MVDNRHLAKRMLNKLIGHPIIYAIKSPDMDLCDFGFGFSNDYQFAKDGTACMQPLFAIHSVCLVGIQEKHSNNTNWSSWDTPATIFKKMFQVCLGCTVKTVCISKRGNLTIDLGVYIVKFIANDPLEENWRFFRLGLSDKHVVEVGRKILLH